MANDTTDRLTGWQTKLWGGVAAALGIAGLLLLIFVGYTVSQVASLVSRQGITDLTFIFSGMTLLILTLLRLLAMLIGAGMIFGGLAVSFFTHSVSNQVGGEAVGNFKGSLSTNSPGLAAIVVGSVVILAALFAQGEFKYDAPTYRIISADELVSINGEQAALPHAEPASATASASATRPIRSASEVLGAMGKK